MFGWFRPRCPCDPAAKAWIEERLAWLSEEFEDSAFTGRQIVLPTPHFFPDPYDGSHQAARVMFDRVCGYMDVVPDLVTLRFVEPSGDIWLVNDAGHVLPGAPAGTYEEDERAFVVTLNESQLREPMDLVGTMAHELAHVRLMGESRMMGDEFDNELLTDLTVVHFGLGVFLANVPRDYPSQLSKWPGSDLNKPEYMTPAMYGYALGHLAWFQGEEKPAWAKHLNWMARGEFKDALRFLYRVGESSFLPHRFRERDRVTVSERRSSRR